jgi:hypothetical protein
MGHQSHLVWVMAAVELLAGLALLLMPATALAVLLGTPQPAVEAVGVSRLAGVALLAIAVMCGWRADDAPSRGLLAGLLVYNIGACAVLAYVGAGLGLSGPLLWPAVLLHAALTVWTLASLKNVPKR